MLMLVLVVVAFPVLVALDMIGLLRVDNYSLKIINRINSIFSLYGAMIEKIRIEIQNKLIYTNSYNMLHNFT